MTIEERIDNDLRQLSADLQTLNWQSAKDERAADDTPQEPEPAKPAERRKPEGDLKNKAARLLDLMISLGEIERRGGGKKPS